MDDLVERLSKGSHPVEAARPDKTANALKECIERDYVHIMFKNTGTELGVQIDRRNSNLAADFQNGTGNVHIEGGLTLNYVKVKVVADIELATLEGQGYLVPVNDEEYRDIMGKEFKAAR